MSRRSSKVAWLFAPHITNTARCEETLNKSILLAKDAKFVISECYRCAKCDALGALRGISGGLEAIPEKAINDEETPIAQLDRVLSDYKLKFDNINSDHQRNMDSAWRAWKDATKAIVTAGQALQEHSDILVTLQAEMGAHTDLSEDERNDALNIKGVLERQNDELRSAFLRGMKGLQADLTYAPTILSVHERIWEKECKKVVRMFAETEAAIVAADTREMHESLEDTMSG